MRTEMDAIAAAVADGDHPRVFYEVGYTDATGQIFAPADDSFVAEMVTLAGGDAITTGDPASYEIPLETLIEADPQIIVLGVNPFYMPTPEQVAARPGWDVMTAVKDGAIVPVQDTEITRPGPRLPIGLRNLAAAIRPGRDRCRRRRRSRSSAMAAPAALQRPSRRRPCPPVAGPVAAGRWASAPVVALVVLLVAGVGLGTVRIRPSETIGIILSRTLGHRHRRDLDAGRRDDRLGPAPAARPDRDGRRGRAGPRRGDVPGPAAQPAGRPVRARHRVRRRARRGDRHPAAGRGHGLRLRPAPGPGLRRGARRGARRVPARWRRRAGRADPPAADRLRGRRRC